jgi:hypothetical protein
MTWRLTFLRRQHPAAAFSFAVPLGNPCGDRELAAKTCGRQGDSVLPIWKS